MTLSLRPATVLPVFLAALLLPGSRAVLHADDTDATARRTAAADLLNTMHLDQTVASATKRMLANLDGMAERMGKQPNLTPEQTQDIQKFREEIHTLIDQQLGWDAVKPDVIQAYADDFTEGEIKELTAFYRTPTGQKLVEKQPELSTKLGQAMQKKSAVLAPTIQKKIQEIRAETRPPVPVAPAKGPEAAPAAPPTTVVLPAPTPAAPTAPVPPVPTPATAAPTPAVSAVTAPIAVPMATSPAMSSPTVPPTPTPVDK